MPQHIGLDVDKFENDMAGLAAKTRVDQDRARGRGNERKLDAKHLHQ